MTIVFVCSNSISKKERDRILLRRKIRKIKNFFSKSVLGKKFFRNFENNIRINFWKNIKIYKKQFEYMMESHETSKCFEKCLLILKLPKKKERLFNFSFNLPDDLDLNFTKFKTLSK